MTDFASAHDDFVRNPFKIENLFALNHNIPGHGTIDHFMMTHEWARVAGRAAATFFAGWFGPWAAAGANAMITGYEVWLAGGSSQDIHKASAISFATSMAFNFVGRGVSAVNANYGAGAATAFKIVGHAAVGCASAEASGGDCQSGAISAGFGAATASANGGLILASVAGGIGAELGGGKFANGALTGAMGYFFNSCGGVMEGCNFLPGHAEALMVNPNPTGEGSMGFNRGISVPDANVTQGRNYSVSTPIGGRFALISTTSYDRNGSQTGQFDGIAYNGGRSASGGSMVSYEWGDATGPGLRFSGNLGNGMAGGTASLFVSPTGVNFQTGGAMGNVSTRWNIGIGYRNRN